MEELKDIQLLPYERPAKLSYQVEDFNSEYSGQSRTAVIDRDQIEIFSPQDTLSDYRLILRGREIQNLTDETIVRLVRGGLEIGTLFHHINSLKWILASQDKVLNLYTLDQLRKENLESIEYLKNAAAPYINLTEIVQLLAQVEYVFAGNCESSGHVYCLSDQLGHYKIGMTRQLNARIKQLGTQPPFEIQLIASHLVYSMREYEACLHWLFREKRLSGEWFTLSDKDVQSFKDATWPSQYMHQRHVTYGGL